MTLRVVNQGEEAMLDLITDVDMTLRLFRTDVESGLTDEQKDALTQASFTEANFAGYAGVSMTTAWTTTQGNPSEATRADVTFTRSSTGAAQTIYGYYVTRNSDGALQWYEYFDGPFIVEFLNDAITVTPTLTLDDDQEAEVAAKGVIAQFSSTTSSAGFTADSDTDMVLNNVPVVAGHLYKIHFHSTFTLSATGDWAVHLKINTVSTQYLDRTNPDSAENGVFDGTFYWEAPATASTDDFLLAVDELGGAATLTLFANSVNQRTLTIEDVGLAP